MRENIKFHVVEMTKPHMSMLPAKHIKSSCPVHGRRLKKRSRICHRTFYHTHMINSSIRKKDGAIQSICLTIAVYCGTIKKKARRENMDNEVLNTIFARSSIRAYTDEPLTTDEINALSDVALASPTAMNRQNQRYFFITNKELIDEWEKAVGEVIEKKAPEEVKQRMRDRKGKVFYNAPLFVAITVDKSGKFSMVDAGIAVGILSLAAKSMGLDSVILGFPDVAFEGDKKDYLREKIGIPESHDFAIGIAIGHPAMDKAPHDTDSRHVIHIK